MPPKPAVIANKNDTLDYVLNSLQSQKTGCVIIVDDQKNPIGIFTERDYILKVARHYSEYKDKSISEFMTKDPVVQTLDCTIAYALTLMSEGGFRNLPIVNEQNIPVGIIAVKDVVDFIVGNFMNKLLSFPVES
jgi:CBS domain-containing protein